MSLAIITAIRSFPQLKGALKFTAIELAHRASRAGHVRVAYSFLAQKTGLTTRTMMRHIRHLVDLGVIEKHTRRCTRTRCEVNLYVFRIRGAGMVHRRACDRCSQKFPNTSKGEEKWGTLGDVIRQLEKGMRLLTPGSVPYASCLERLETLRALFPQPGEE
jgi:DNA-binding transcriptional ArsR family regulator